MERGRIAAVLFRILRDVLDDPTLEVTDTTRPEEVSGWSSVRMVDVVLDVEDAFDIRLDGADIDGIETVGDLIEAIRRRLGWT